MAAEPATQPPSGRADEKAGEISPAASGGDSDSAVSAAGPAEEASGAVTQTAGAAAGTAADDAAPAAVRAPEETRTRLQTVLIMLSLGSALFLAALDVTIVTVAVPTISGEFDSTVGYTWIGSAYLLANAASAPSWGKISDIWGRKQILLVAVAVFWVGSLLSATSVNMAMLIAARAVQGIGGGGIVILVNVSISGPVLHAQARHVLRPHGHGVGHRRRHRARHRRRLYRARLLE